MPPVPGLRVPRVLMVTGAYYPEISSGGLQCQTMARALGGRAEIAVLTTAVDRSLPPTALVDGVPVTRIHVDVTSALSRAAALARMASALRRLVAAADVVHIHGCSSKNVPVTLAARLARRPIVLSLHTADHDEPDSVRSSGRLQWWAYRAADRCLSVSPGLVQAYLAAGLPADRIAHVPNGIDTARFTPAGRAERQALRQQLNLAPDRPTIVFVGFFSRDKQPDVLVDAWLATRDRAGLDTTLVLVGATQSAYYEVDEDMSSRLRAAAAARGCADRLVMPGTTHVVDQYLRAADVFVLPSRREGLPVALLEAMACGLPCIASRLPGSTETIIVDGSSGVLVPPGDTAALARALEAIIRDPAAAAAMGRRARETVVERFSSEAVAARWLAVYEASISGARG